MTTTGAVDARCNVGLGGSIEQRSFAGFRGAGLRGSLAALAIGLALTGCSSSGLLDSATSDVQSVSALPAKAAAPVSRSSIALAPLMGAPEAVSKQVGSHLSTSLQRQNVGVASGSDRADYTLRGYMVATRERAGTKLAYIFDLTDGAGKRINRIQGEEMAQGGDARDPWSALTPEISQRITDKAATSLAATLTNLPSSPTAAAMSPPAGAGASTAPVPATPAAATSAPTTGSINTAAVPSSAATSIPLAATVPAVSGAPGDGNASLSAAMRQELQQAGVGAAGEGQRAYSVAGKVAVSAAKDGKQSIKIDWRVTDPNGALLATVSQNNEIQAGALDGSWGNIANDAAQGAAARIKQLIDEHRAGAGKVGAQTAARSKG